MLTPRELVPDHFKFALDDTTIGGLKWVHRKTKTGTGLCIRLKLLLQHLFHLAGCRLELMGMVTVARSGDVDLEHSCAYHLRCKLGFHHADGR